MGRFTRVVAIDVPQHVTQRGNGRRYILGWDADRAVYLNLLRENLGLYGVALIGYCLMSNYVHLVAVPRKADGLADMRLSGSRNPYWVAVSRLERFGQPPAERMQMHTANIRAGSSIHTKSDWLKLPLQMKCHHSHVKKVA
jgi:hypothetical protein